MVPTPHAIGPDLNLRQALKKARQAATGPAHTVLDALLKDTQCSAAQLRQLLESEAGVRVVMAEHEAASLSGHPHFAALRTLKLVPVQLQRAGANGLHLAAADPWDADLASQACALLQATPPFVAAPGALLRQWLNESVKSVQA